MSHLPPFLPAPPPSLPAPPTFDAFSNNHNPHNQAQGSFGGGGYDPSHIGGGAPNDPPRDMYAERNNNRRGGGPGGGRGGPPRRGGGGGGGGGDTARGDRRDRGGDRGRSPDRGGRRRHEQRSVEDRIQAERVCRTLFVRNVSYEADSTALQNSFSSYGEIKTWYDVISERGIIFVTYYDLRAAQRARDGMHGLKAGDRSIDVHYSLPRDKDLIGDCDREKNQGSILIFVHPPRVVSEYELGRMCEQYGEVKSIKPGREPAEKIVEYYDSRCCITFFDTMKDQPFQGGILELKFIWDEKEDALPPPPLLERSRNQPHRSGEGPGYGEVRGGRSGGPPPPRDAGNGYGGPRDPRARSPIRGGDRRGSYGSNPPGPGRYGDLPPSAPPGEDRLEQARKVQQLLANLGGPSGNTAPPPPPLGGNAYPPRSMPPPSLSGPPPPMNNYPPRDIGYTPGGPPLPPLARNMGGDYRSSIPPPPAQGGFPPYPPPNNSGPPPPPSAQGYSPANNQGYQPPGNNYGGPPPPSSANAYAIPPPSSHGPYNPLPPNQPYTPNSNSGMNSYNPSTPAPGPGAGPSQAYPPYPPPMHSNGGPPPPPRNSYPPPTNQGYNGGPNSHSNPNSGGYGFPNNNNRPGSNSGPGGGGGGGGGGGQAKDVGSLLAMLSNR